MNTNINLYNAKPLIFMLIFIALIFNSCEENVTDIEITKSKPQLVVYSFISPNLDKSKVSVSMSKPIYNNAYNEYNYQIVDTALVTITGSNGISASLYFNTISKFYEIDSASFPIKEGVTYNLSVKTFDGKNATANCTVPYKVNNQIKFESLEKFNEYNWVLKFSFTDAKGEGDLYDIKAFQHDIQSGRNSSILNEKIFISDKDNDNKEIFISKYVHSMDNYYSGNKLLIRILKTDKNYYEYYKNVNNIEGGFEYFTEPVFVHFNIEGGFGAFGAYTIDEALFDIEQKK